MKKLLKPTLNKLLIAFAVIDLILSLLFFSWSAIFLTFKKEAGVLSANESFVEIYKPYRNEKITGNLISQMSDEQKVGQIFMLSVSGTSLNPQTQILLEKYGIGGIAFLGSNIENKNQLISFTSQINSKSKIDPIIAVDQENNYVHRISWDPTLNSEVTQATMEKRSETLKEAGINMNLAPVLDLPLVQSSFMKGRFIGSLAPEVITRGEAYLLGHDKNSVLTSIKHFPGHGRTTTDSHLTLPVIPISKEELVKTELEPFRALIEAGSPVVMTGHLLFPEIDSEPASLSKVFQTDILRGELGFDGMILSDDMNMGSLSGEEDKFARAIKAGTNMLIYVQYYPQQIETLDALVSKYATDAELKGKIDESVKLILTLKCEYKVLEECK